VPAEQVTADPILNEAAKQLKPSTGWPTTPGYTYNAMIYPLANTSIAGALWYQGESNTMTSASYSKLLQMLIATWRKSWNATIPFYIVQIAPFAYGNPNVGALLRESQVQTLAVPQTGLVVTSDIAEDTADIHPRNKREVGYRLAGLALDDIYLRKGDSARSPLYREMILEKNTIVISFDHASTGLVVHGKAAAGVFIAGVDRVFYPAQVKVSGNTLIVSSKKVKQPVAVRYAFSNTALGNLFSQSGLPVSPFRTDNWNVDTGLPANQ
jgi:sialate O-acetylesterase